MKKKYDVGKVIVSWKSKEKEQAGLSRALRSIKRAEFMIKFWQDEIKYWKEV